MIRRWKCIQATIVLSLALARPSPGAARLEYRGAVITARQAEILCAPALRSAFDPLAESAALGALLERLQSLGYLNARLEASWDSLGGGRLVVIANEGVRFRIGALSIEAPQRQDSVAIAAVLGLATGIPASPVRVQEALDRALDALAGSGHPYAELGIRAWDLDSASVRIAIAGSLGPAVQVTDVRIDGLHVTRRDLALHAMGHLIGLRFDRAAAEDARDRLEALGLFRSVSWEGIEGEGDWSRAHLVYRVDEPHYNQFEGAVGLQGARGAVGLAHLELGNMLGTGRAVDLRWESRGQGVSQFEAHGSEPQVLGLPLRLEATLGQDVQDTIYVRTRWGGRAVFALSGRERVEAGFEEERVVQDHDVVEEADISSTVFALERSTLDAPIGARRGMRARVTATESFQRQRLRPEGQLTSRASAGELGVEWHRPLSEWTTLGIDLRASGRFSSERVLPLFERYPLGGAASLRGYDEDQFRVDRYALSRLEWGRELGPGGQSAYLFWDHAWSATRVALQPSGDRLETSSKDGIGFGLRVAAAGGLAGIEYGLAAGRPPLEGKIHVRLLSRF